jgi:UDP-N-acetylglucosamine 2-epimerase
MPLLKKLKIPRNIEIFESCPYSTMVENLAGCKFILTDSGGVQKTAPFFGKKALVFREKIEWVETETAGYIRKADYSAENLNWLLLDDLKCDTMFYMSKDKKPSEIMYESIVNSLGGSE